LVETGPGIITAALTMAAAFYALTLTDFLGLRELGFITGSGLLLILLLTFMVLPALLVLDERWRATRPVNQQQSRQPDHGGYLEPLYRYPWVTLVASAVFIGIAFLVVGGVETDFNLLRLQSERTESVVWARKIFASTQRSLLNGELMAATLEEVDRKAAALHRLPSVEKVDSILSVLPQDQEAKLRLLMDLRPLVADVALQDSGRQTFDLAALRDTLQRIAGKLGNDDGPPATPTEASTQWQLHEVRQLIATFLQRVQLMDHAEVQRALTVFQSELLADLEGKLATFRQNLSDETVTPDDLPPELRARYLGKSGKFRLFVFPREDIWEHQALARFVTDLTAVDADAIGAPVTNFAYIKAITEGYEKAGLLALIGIVLLTFLTFRAMPPTLLALVPLMVGGVWTLGLMALFQVQFNLANIIAIPLIIGIGVDSGILIVHRFWVEQEQGVEVAPLIRSTGKAITLSSLTEIVGFGSLLMANHRGIYSLGLLVTLGLASVLIASLTTLPSLLAVFGPRHRETVPGSERIWQSAGGEAD
jgi:predicted RND superfamily exporter protein